MSNPSGFQNSPVYDFVVIGGGSGGMSAAKAAANAGAKVACFDYVTPSPQGTTWKLGGTCVNVGCVPKKLMHFAALMGSSFEDARTYGWQIDEETKLSYPGLISNVTNYVKKLNFAYRKGLTGAKVEYINAKARLTDSTPSTGEVQYVDKEGNTGRIIGRKILLAVGGRPVIPCDVAGAIEHAITSDDIFWRKKAPGRTLVVGGSYIALECAGFLTHLGFDTTVAVRSILLRGFDRQCSEKVGKVMEERGTKFLYGSLPRKIEPNEDGADHKYKVTFTDESEDHFDTIMYATGRYPDTDACGCKDAGLEMKEGKILTSETTYETSVPNVYAVGDIVSGNLELTPVAIAQGEFLARHLFDKSGGINNTFLNVPTTVFTPGEYGSVGMTEEEAIATYGEAGIEVYHSEFEALEISAAGREKVESLREDEFDTDASPSYLAKLVCTRRDEKILGIHFVGDHAGEVIQGFAVAMSTGVLTKEHFDSTIGIHPTAAEVFTTMEITKRSGENHISGGGCGGGKCG